MGIGGRIWIRYRALRVLMMRTAIKYMLLYLVSVVTIYIVYHGIENVFPIEKKLIIRSLVQSIGVIAGLLFTYNYEKLKRKFRTRH
jgi:hypothetical protein